MNNKPTRSGFYWYRIIHGFPQVVEVDMTYQYRGKVIPMLLGNGWKKPLDHIPEHVAQWSARLECPFKEEHP
jgi:hypothetical protein